MSCFVNITRESPRLLFNIDGKLVDHDEMMYNYLIENDHQDY